MDYKYAVLFASDESSFSFTAPDQKLPFTGLLHVGEKVILPQHMKCLDNMPQWVKDQGSWEVREVIHQVDGVALYDGKIIILIPCTNPLIE